MANQWNSGINDRKIKEQICEIGRRVYAKGFAAANDGNITVRLNDRELLCTPTMVSKGFMKPEDICKVDYEGKQLAGTKKRTSEVLLHLVVYKHRPDVNAVVHCHPPHATAFAVAHEPIPKCTMPEFEVFLGEVPVIPLRLANLPDILLLYRLRLGSVNRTQGALQAGYIRKVLRDARIRRGLPAGPEVLDFQEASIQPDDGRGSWAHWSHDAFHGGYRDTARRYAWRAMRSEPLAVSSWKAVLRPYFRHAPSPP
jgi:hypothetical protein